MKVLGYIKRKIDAIGKIIYRCFSQCIPLHQRTIIFLSFHGRGYSDNPRAIYEQMKKDPAFQDYRFIWFIKNHKKKDISIDGAEVKEYSGLSYYYWMAKAKYWIINCKMPTYLYKKPEQVYLQTWHGTPLKRLGHDIIVTEGMTFYRSQLSFQKMCESYDKDVAKYNYMISPNTYCTQIFQTAFGINRERLIETGYPRNDKLINKTAADKKKLRDKYHLPQEKKVILYAPTWRDNSYASYGYTFDLKANFHAWKKQLGDEYVVVFKPHYLIINKYKDDCELEGFLYSMDADIDINELYVVSDILITDYSSTFFDYALLNQPIYFYMYDLDEYQEELRGFYLDIYQDLPGTIYNDESAMLVDISECTFDYDRLQQFNQRFGDKQTGDSSQKVIDIVFK